MENNRQNNPLGSFSSAMSDRLLQTRTVVVSEPTGPELTARVTEQLAALASTSDDPITLMMTNLPGDDLASALSLYDVIHTAGPPVKIIAAGQIKGAGLIPFIASPIRDRVALPNARFLLHQAKGGGSSPGSDVSQQAEEIRRLRTRSVDLLAEATGQDPEQVEKDMKHGTWLTAEEAQAYGFIDRIVQQANELEFEQLF